MNSIISPCDLGLSWSLALVLGFEREELPFYELARPIEAAI